MSVFFRSYPDSIHNNPQQDMKTRVCRSSIFAIHAASQAKMSRFSNLSFGLWTEEPCRILTKLLAGELGCVTFHTNDQSPCRAMINLIFSDESAWLHRCFWTKIFSHWNSQCTPKKLYEHLTRYLSKHIKSYLLFLHCFRLRLDLRLQMTVTWINYPSLILIFSQIYNAEIRHNNRDNETIIDNWSYLQQYATYCAYALYKDKIQTIYGNWAVITLPGIRITSQNWKHFREAKIGHFRVA